jgi:hypothetical protein
MDFSPIGEKSQAVDAAIDDGISPDSQDSDDESADVVDPVTSWSAPIGVGALGSRWSCGWSTLM